MIFITKTCVVWVVITLTNRSSTINSNLLRDDKSIRDLLDRKISGGHLQTSSVFFLCCVSSSHLFWNSSFVGIPAGVTQEEGHTDERISHPPSFCGAPLFFSREGFSHSFPSSTVKSNSMY